MTKPDTTVHPTPMNGEERKRAFRSAVAAQGSTLSVAALLGVGVTWDHLSRGLSDDHHASLSRDVKLKFAAYIGRTYDDVFGPDSNESSAA